MAKDDLKTDKLYQNKTQTKSQTKDKSGDGKKSIRKKKKLKVVGRLQTFCLSKRPRLVK